MRLSQGLTSTQQWLGTPRDDRKQQWRAFPEYLLYTAENRQQFHNFMVRFVNSLATIDMSFWNVDGFYIAQALRVALLRAPPNTFFEDTFMWSGEDTFPGAEFPSATELPREDAFRRHFSRSRISPRHRITSRRRFSKTLFPQPNFSPPPNCPPKTLFPQPNLRPPPNCPFRGEKE